MNLRLKTVFGDLILDGDFSCVADLVRAAIAAKKSLSSADLRHANLSSANLSSADLRHANLSSANLSSADLSSANLSSADLSSADLSSAGLRYADLRYADLRHADLSSADLSSADLRHADLSSADLRHADLRSADLRHADLRSANLRHANLSSANLSSDELLEILSQRTILPEGDLIGYKKLANDTIAKLRIPADAKRIGGLVGRKCRAEFAIVMEGEGASRHDDEFLYKVGETVRPANGFCDNPMLECEAGIHFFITRAEAEAYQ